MVLVYGADDAADVAGGCCHATVGEAMAMLYSTEDRFTTTADTDAADSADADPRDNTTYVDGEVLPVLIEARSVARLYFVGALAVLIYHSIYF